MTRPLRLVAPIAAAAAITLLACPFGLAASSPAAPDSAAPLTTLEADSTAAPPTFDAEPRPAAPQSPAASYALRLGFENVRAERASAERLAYENRRFRHSVDAYGHLVRGDRDLIAFEQRLGLTAAAIERRSENGVDRFRVSYPSDPDFIRPPRGPRLRPTSNSLDLIVGPLFSYDLGRITQPIQFQIQTEITARYNPWPGGRLTGSIVLPMYNDFLVNDLHPDADNVRPGLVTVEQFAWIPRGALVSGTMGVFADNRYGISFGVARPLYEGAILLDAQTDLTGFVAFGDEIEYSPADRWSTFGGVTWRPPWRDVALRARYAQFLYGDHGAELAFTRSFGDFDIVLSVTRSQNLTNEVIRLVFPIPPLTRPTRTPVRTLPIDRFPLSFRTDATPVGLFLVGVASREEFLRQLSKPEFENNRHRYDRARGVPRPAEPEAPILWSNHQGMSGFVITPWAGVRSESEVELGFTTMPRAWSYNPGRGVYRNEIYYANFGLLPRLETGIRITRTSGFNPFGYIDPLSELSTDTDHMVSFRFALLEPRPGRPGVAVGVDDMQGTRRYHGAYLVTGLPLEIFRVQNRFSLGYAPRVFTASRHVLDGAFGAIEVSPWRSVAARFEYDTEKLNVGLGVDLGFGLRIRAAALNLESLSAGVGWHHKL